MRKLIFILIIVCSNRALALSIDCAVDYKFIAHKAEIDIEYSWDVDTWLVQLNAPYVIEDLEFSYMQVNKENEGIAIPLLSEKEGDHVSAHFYVGNKTFDRMNVRVFYGRHCLQNLLIEIEPNGISR